MYMCVFICVFIYIYMYIYIYIYIYISKDIIQIKLGLMIIAKKTDTGS